MARTSVGCKIIYTHLTGGGGGGGVGTNEKDPMKHSIILDSRLEKWRLCTVFRIL